MAALSRKRPRLTWERTGRFRRLQNRCNIRCGQALDVAQDDREALLFRQQVQRLLQDDPLLLPFETGAGIAGRIDRLGLIPVDECLLTLQASPRHVAAHVDGDPEQPRLERFPGISPVQILERPKEHVLRDVARVVSTAQQPRRQRHHAAFVADDDLLERRSRHPGASGGRAARLPRLRPPTPRPTAATSRASFASDRTIRPDYPCTRPFTLSNTWPAGKSLKGSDRV